jgi:thioredoxin
MNDQSIERVLGVNLPVVFVFLPAEPAPGLAEVLKEIAKNYSGQLLVADLRLSENPAAAGRYQVQHAPAVVIVKNREVLSKSETITAGDLEKYAAYALGKGPRPVERTQTGPTRRPDLTGERPAGAAIVLTVTDASFPRDVLQSPFPVLVDFWAPWCGPCRITEPMVQRLGSELGEKLVVAKVNVDENPGLSRRYNVQGIPTMMLVKDGEVVDRWTGALPEQALRSRVLPVIS